MSENVGGWRQLWPLAMGCALGSAMSWRVQAAEYSFAPIMSWTTDYSSNRYLAANSLPGEGGFITFDALLTRTTSILELDLKPSLAVQRFSNNSATDTFNRSLAGSSTWTRERSTFNLGGSYSDLSTLTTELASTGITQGNTHQRQAVGTGYWQWQQSENRQSTVSLGYNDTTYVGQQASVLPGYRNASVAIAERFTLSDPTALTVTAYGGDLRSNTLPSESDAQLTIAVDHSFTERFTMYASAGANDRRSSGQYNPFAGVTDRSASGQHIGYVGEVWLKRIDERNQWKVDYARTVAASGFGVLTVHDEATLSFSRDLTSQLSAGLKLGGSQDKYDVATGPFVLLSRRYETADASLNWMSGETSTLSLGSGYQRATASSDPPTPLATGWRVSVTYRWTPHPTSFSR